MSLEESMQQLAKSNFALAEAQAALAERYDRILNGEAEIVPVVTGKSGGAAADGTKKGPGRPPGKKAAPVVEDDGLGGDDDVENDDAEPTRTADEVKKALQEFKAAGGAPKDIMSKFGAKAFPEIKEADFNAVYDATVKATAKL